MTWCMTVHCTRGVKLACSQSSMNLGSSSGQSLYHTHGWYRARAAIFPKGWGSWPVTDISSKATGQGFATFLGRRVAAGQLVSSKLGGELFLAFPLPFQLAGGGGGVPLLMDAMATGQCPSQRAWAVAGCHHPWPAWQEGGLQLCGHRLTLWLSISQREASCLLACLLTTRKTSLSRSRGQESLLIGGQSCCPHG